MPDKIKIERGHLMSLKTDMNDAFMGNVMREHIIITYEPVLPPSFPEDAILYLTYFQESKEPGGDFIFRIQATWEYKLYPRKSTTAEDIYECAKLTQSHLQEVVSTIFNKQKSFIEIRIPSFEDEIDEINTALLEIQR